MSDEKKTNVTDDYIADQDRIIEQLKRELRQERERSKQVNNGHMETIQRLQSMITDAPLLRHYVDEVNTFHHTALLPLVDAADALLAKCEEVGMAIGKPPIPEVQGIFDAVKKNSKAVRDRLRHHMGAAVAAKAKTTP